MGTDKGGGTDLQKTAQGTDCNGGGVTPEQEAERMAAIIAVDNECERCGSVAWSRQLEAALHLRPKRGNPDRKEVVCGQCRSKQEAKKTRRGKAA